jgi:hypothetical protein
MDMQAGTIAKADVTNLSQSDALAECARSNAL